MDKRVDDLISEFQLGAQKQRLWMFAGFFVVVILVTLAGLHIFARYYLSGLVLSHQYSVSIQEWRDVSNGIEGGWQGLPPIEKVCFFRDGSLVYGTEESCSFVSQAASILSGRTITFARNGLTTQVHLTTSLWEIIACLSVALVGLLLLIATLTRRFSSSVNKTQLIEALRKVNLPGSEPQSEFEKVIKAQSEEIVALKRDAEIGKLASQISHDIRSPLAALEMVAKLATGLPEDQRLLIRGSTARIKDIANNLLQKNRPALASSVADKAVGSSEMRSAQLLSSLIDKLVSEKRMQYRTKMAIQIEAILNESAYGLFASIHGGELHRVLSNLVNNAVEVLSEKGKVTLGLREVGGDIVITVTDDGRGIPPEILGQLGQRGASFGKEGTESGSGLGLYHARTTIENWGGRLEIDSTVGAGTTVSLKLPKAQAPRWFLAQLDVPSGGIIVILDDDDSIHRVWDGRLQALSFVGASRPNVEHFSTPDQLRLWAQGTSAAVMESAVCLIDYELIGFKETGLDLIESLQLTNRSVLVTSRYEEPEVVGRCERAGVKLLPKNLAAGVPIVLF